MATVAVIGALQLFDQAVIAGGVNGDPDNALMTIVLYLYNAAFTQFDFDYAAAVGIVLFVIIFTHPRPAPAVRRGADVVRARPMTTHGPEPVTPAVATAPRPSQVPVRRRQRARMAAAARATCS